VKRFVNEAGAEVNRYKLTKSDNTSETVYLERAAELTQEGTALNAENLNGVMDMAVHFCTCSYSGGVYTLKGDTMPESIGAVPINVQFVAPSQFKSGETFRYGNQTFTPKNAGFMNGDLVVIASLVGSQIFFRSGGASTPPSEWEDVGLYTANATLTVLQRGWYRITCIGAGGNGGSGGDGDLYDWTAWDEGYEAQAGGGGAAGGSGGIASAVFLLDRGNYVITVNGSASAFAELIAAYAGKAGGNGGWVTTAGDDSSPGVGGAGGAVEIADGAIVEISQAGKKGNNGSNPKYGYNAGTAGANGVVTAASHKLLSYTAASGGTAGTTNKNGGNGGAGQTGSTSAPRFGGSGAGGGGGSGPSKVVGNRYLENYSAGGSGGKGAPGCVYIEKGASA
jgi:hypothetical protein